MSDEGIQHPPVEGVHHEFILCKDVRIHVARAGMGASKKLILFLHGFPECVNFPGGILSEYTSLSTYVTTQFSGSLCGHMAAPCTHISHAGMLTYSCEPSGSGIAGEHRLKICKLTMRSLQSTYLASTRQINQAKSRTISHRMSAKS